MDTEESIQRLREWCPPGTTVHLILRHVSRSGMQRVIDPIVFLDSDAQNPRYIGGLVAKALSWRYSEKWNGVIVDGCGMDMGFHLVNALSYAIHGHEKVGDNATPFSASPDGYVGGYSLSYRWL